MSYVLFISEDKLKDSTAINLNVDVNLLLPYVRQAQKLYVETKLGTDLNNKLKDLIVAGTVGAGVALGGEGEKQEEEEKVEEKEEEQEEEKK